MITKIEIGTHTITEVEEVNEIIQNEGDYILKGLTINIKQTEKNTIHFLETIFSGNVGTIKVYGKEEIPKANPMEEQTYAEEKLIEQYSDYTGTKSIYYSLDLHRFTISLSMSAARIADQKYKELLEERDKLKKTVDAMSMALADIMGGGE